MASLIVKIGVNFIPAHWNQNANATIPEYWEAQVLSGIELDPLKVRATTRIFGTTRSEAIGSLIAELQAAGYHGRAKVVDL